MITRQEMFDRAWRGLASQGWEKCTSSAGSCVYKDGSRHCAWGWVDPEGTNEVNDMDDLSVHGLFDNGIGLAANLDQDDLTFAANLQHAHDRAAYGRLRESMERFAREQRLTVPDEAP